MDKNINSSNSYVYIINISTIAMDITAGEQANTKTKSL